MIASRRPGPGPLVLGLVVLGALACGSGAEPTMAPPSQKRYAPMELREEMAYEPEAAAAPADDGDGKLVIIKGGRVMNEGGESRGVDLAALGALGGYGAKTDAIEKKPAEPPGTEATPVRTWFPEAFLWRPVVETSPEGTASLDVRVPDQLTTWRVLALAHDRSGHQAGDVHTFDSVLPAYVDPVVPAWSYVGDSVRLPVQVVSNQARGVGGALSVSASGAVDGGDQVSVALGPFGSDVLPVGVLAVRAGEARVQAGLSGVDAVVRTWPVHPVGRPVVAQRGGTLTGSRVVPIAWADGSDPRTAQLAVEVHPGPLAVLSAELTRLQGGARASGAYAYGLAGHLEALSAATGTELPPGALRTLRIKAWQRMVREARSPSAGEAADLLLSLERAGDEPLVAQLRDRLVRTVVSGQRGDGTWARQDRDTFQRVLVQTAVAARSLPADQAGPRLRAQGAIERHQPNIDDPYTAAVILGAGLSSFTEPLRELVLKGLVEVDGRKTVAIPKDVGSAWSSGPPSRAEVLAWTALALQPTDPDLAGDLVAELMTGYSSARGFGAGPADPLALEAVVRALPTVDAPIRLSLAVDGEVRATASVDPAQPRVPAILSFPPTGVGSGEVTLSAEPASAGLSWVLTQRSWVPWTGTERLPGVEVEVRQSDLRAGVEGTLTLSIAAPSGARVTVVQGLPSGVTVDADRIEPRARLASVDVQQDRVELTTHAFGAGEVLEVRLPVQPTYAGRMASLPLEVEVAGRAASMAPHVWSVSP